ncbi:MAG: substrate-binding domain-containing protein, partial [Candidatus Eremiobacteraeota bacterium]|nr:substrate-binding domain-containing protein [Candidatus Eremiobacteraeota bacterium]
MNKSLAALALAAGIAVAFSACNGSSGGSGVSSLPNAPLSSGHRIHRLDDAGPSSLHAGGASFPGEGYNLGQQPVGSATGSPPPNTQPTPGIGSLLASYGGDPAYYCLTGSTKGRAEFDANASAGYSAAWATSPCATLTGSFTGFGGRQDPLDFTGTDIALTSSECCGNSTPYYTGRYNVGTSLGWPFEIPVLGGPIVFPYNASSFTIPPSQTAVQFSTWTYCAIANGTISSWNDAAIQGDNGGSITGGVPQTLDFYYRSDSAGTSYLFTEKLNHSCNGAWKGKYAHDPYQDVAKGRDASWSFGVNSQWPGPNTGRFHGESGNANIILGIQGDAYGTGYSEGAWAAAAGIAQAALL